MRSLDEIRGAGAPVSEILLAPLGPDDVAALVGDALHWDAERAQPLADLVYEKTGGNPFFVIQFLGTLAQEKLLAFDAGAAGWEADLEGIHAKGYTDNVVDLMVGKLGRLPAPAREALKQLACVGSRASCPVLGRVFGQAADAVHAALWPAVSDGLLVRVPGHFAFVHDRLQEAAYSLIPEQQRPEEHLRIGRALLAGMHAGELIDVVDQFNRGASLLVDPDERLRVAELNLRAGRKAKASAAYTSACAYFAAGMALLGEGEWDRHYGLTFGLWLERAECEYLCGNGQQVELLVAQLLARGASRIDLAAAYRLRIDLHVMRSKYPEAVDTALECLRLFGIDMPAHPTREQVDAEYERVWRNLGERPIASLLELPRMTDPDVQAAMGVLALLNSPAYFTDAGLVRLHLCHMVNLTLAHGMSDASPHALGLLGRRYAWFDLPAGWRVARYTDAHAFASLACDLVDKHGLTASRPKVQLTMALTAVWTQPVGVAVDHMRAAHEAAVEGGDLTIACYSLHHLLVDLLLRGDPLEEVWRETERALDFVCKARFRDVADVIVAHQRFIQNLRGRTASFSTFGDAGFDEAAFEAGLGGAGMTMIVCLYWVLKQQARFLSGDHEEAAAAGRKAEALLASAAGHVQLLDYHFYAVLLACATWDALPADARQPAGERLQAHLRQLSEWAGRGGPIFHGRHALALAEVARIEGREQDAQRLYEEAIRHSREQRFVQVEALAYELAGSFYAARGFAEFAALYLRQAHHAWLRWGAAGKARQLEQRHPELREPEPEPAATGILGAPVDQLDLATVIKVSQAVSGEIVLEKMLDTLMRTAIEHAGAGRGLLILPQAGQQTVVAEATTAGDSVVVRMAARPAAATVLPESVLQYVLRTRESVLLDDAVAHGPFAADPYVRDHRARSVLCLPLLNRGQPIGVLYLENNLAPRVFAPARLAVLKLVASEAAVSLENTRLYRDLAEREARIRRLVDANIIGIFIWDLEGRVLDANDAFLRMLGYGRPDLVSGALRWKELTPPEWQLVETQELVPELKSAGSLQPYEKEYFRKDGSRVPVLVGAAAFASGSEGVAFVLDLTERKRAEAESRDSERRAHDMQMRLAEANRLASIGQLSASIAHEINQPLAGIVANANTSLRRLAAVPPNVEGATEIARRLIRDANRASDVIARLRALFGSSQRVTEAVDLNDAAREVVALSSTALQQDRIALRCAFADDLPTVRGDRVQLQQVIMNLLRNACDAMRGLDDRPRQLVLRTVREAGDAIRLSVQDTGVGLDPQRIDKLFDAFYTTKSGGMGIGLSISRTIVERHHGRLWAEPNDGPGATFSFSIPVEPDGTPAAPA
jgi:PAS domain S-box-containing protein